MGSILDAKHLRDEAAGEGLRMSSSRKRQKALLPETRSDLDLLADAMSLALRVPREVLFKKRKTETFLARQALAYTAWTMLEVRQNDVAEWLDMDRKGVYELVERFKSFMDGTEAEDFEDGHPDLAETLEKLGHSLKTRKAIDMSAFDEATIAALRKLQPPEKITPSRRFEDKPETNPSAVRALAPDHPAMRENRSLFPSRVVDVTESAPDRLLVSGENNRKLGDIVAKGRFKGYALYGLSLEERATCPTHCAVRDICYGNSMHMARRHRIVDRDVFYDRLGEEIFDLLAEHEAGVLIRLHVLGDFIDVDYIANWADLLENSEALAVYGYTAHKPESEIGEAIAAVKERFPDRFRIRWSNSQEADGARVLDFEPEDAKVDGAIVCPAQTDATACCATCGLCWEQSSTPIAFIKHGPKSADAHAEAEMKAAAQAPDSSESGLRRVRAITLPRSASRSDRVNYATPEIRFVNPTELHIEASYQRDLSKRSMSLIRKIVGGWDWAKFKPPVCAERGPALVVIDGQHTAIAAATLGIERMPIMLAKAHELEARADAFVSHNRDRLTMSPFQIFHARVTAADPLAVSVSQAAERTGAIIPRSMPARGRAQPGTIIDIRDICRYANTDGISTVERIFRIAVASNAAPLGVTATRSLHLLLTEPYFAEAASWADSRIANGLKTIAEFEATARAKGEEGGQGQVRAGAMMIVEACAIREVAA